MDLRSLADISEGARRLRSNSVRSVRVAPPSWLTAKRARPKDSGAECHPTADEGRAATPKSESSCPVPCHRQDTRRGRLSQADTATAPRLADKDAAFPSALIRDRLASSPPGCAGLSAFPRARGRR